MAHALPRRSRLRLLPPGQWKLMPTRLVASLRKRDLAPMASSAAAAMRSVVGGAGGRLTAESDEVDAEDTMVDFANASLYLSGIQTVFTIICCASVSVLSCWIVPEPGVSAVRTLALCVATGALLMRTPLRVGRAHGVRVVFSALQPAVPIYLTALVVEQLVHTCTAETGHAPSWRRVVFHGMILVMLVSGLMRARAPLQETDMPFLVTAAALLVIAIMPPPAVAFVGPLCQSVTLWEAADRLVRALAFVLVYCAHVYASTSSSSLTSSETIIVVTRSASASLWTMGAHITWLPAAAVQCGIVIVARINVEQKGGYRVVPDRLAHDDDEADELEAGRPYDDNDSPREPTSGSGPHGSGVIRRYSPASSGMSEAGTIDVVAQQRELLAQPTAIQLASNNGHALASRHNSNRDASTNNHNHNHNHNNHNHNHNNLERLQMGEMSMPPEAFPVVVHEVDGNNNNNAMVPGDGAFGPRAFRDIGASADEPPPTTAPPMQPQQHQQQHQQQPPQLQTVVRPPQMSAARMAEIAAAIPD